MLTHKKSQEKKKQIAKWESLLEFKGREKQQTRMTCG